MDLSRLSMRLVVQVTGRVVGLTSSSVQGMSARLRAFFARDPLAWDRSAAALLDTVRTDEGVAEVLTPGRSPFRRAMSSSTGS